MTFDDKASNTASLDDAIFGDAELDADSPIDLMPEPVNATIDEAFELLNSQVEALIASNEVENGEQALVETYGGAISDYVGLIVESAYAYRPSEKKPYKINGYGSLYDGHTLVIFIAQRYGDGRATKGTQEESIALATLGVNYVDFIASKERLTLPKGSEDRETADKVRTLFDKCKKVKFLVVTDREVPTHTHFSRKTIQGRDIAIEWWGISQFASVTDGSHGSKEIILEVKTLMGENDHLYCLESGKAADGMHIYSVHMPGRLLHEVYDRWGQAALDANVRSYLSAGKGKTKANRGIAQTIKESPRMFLAYNNGITLTATEVETYMVNGRPAVRRIKGLQIVNGGQTTATMYYSDRQNLDEVEVMCKIVAVTQDTHAHVKAISTYSNRQNQVKESDLSSNDRYNVNLQKVSRDVAINGHKWYFERTKAQFANEVLLRKRKGELRKFELEFDKNRKFDKTEVASAYSLWDGHPHDVSAGGQTNFSRWHARNKAALEDANRPEMEAREYRALVARIIIWRAACKLHRPRYKDYRRQVSNYTVALIAARFADRIDYQAIWDREAISQEFADQIIRLGDQVLDLIRKSAGERDVTYSCKTENTWLDLRRETELSFDPDVIPEFNTTDGED